MITVFTPVYNPVHSIYKVYDKTYCAFLWIAGEYACEYILYIKKIGCTCFVR